MNIRYPIILLVGVVGVVGIAGGLLIIKEARRYGLRRDKAKAIQLHREMRKLKKAIKEVEVGALPQGDN